MPVNEELDDRFAEVILHVNHVEWDAEQTRDATRVCHLIRCAATIAPAGSAAPRLAPKPHHDADNFIALPNEKRGGY
jgi:hypothetical protein